MNVQTKSAVLAYLINLSEAKDKKNKSIGNQIERAISYIKCWLKGTTAIDFHLDMSNSSSDLEEIDADIKVIITKANGNINIVEECLSYFESKSDLSVGKAYCVNVLKSTKVRLSSRSEY
jgi:hypothetical protein